MTQKSVVCIGLQLPITLCTHQSDIELNLNNAKEMINKHQGDTDYQNVDFVYLLPELFTTGYHSSVFQNLSDLAEDKEGRSFDFFSELAKDLKIYIVYGYPRVVGNGKYAISVNVVGPKGNLVTFYDKLHISGSEEDEKSFFVSGMTTGTGLGSFSINNVNFGISISYDIRFPSYHIQLSKTLNVDVLLHPSVMERNPTFESWKNFVITRAVENQVYILAVNLAGEEYGSSMWVGPSPSLTGFTEMGPDKGFIEKYVDVSQLKKIRDEHTYKLDYIDDYTKKPVKRGRKPGSKNTPKKSPPKKKKNGKKGKKDPDAPKRARTAYVYYSMEKRKELREKYPSAPGPEITKRVTESWNAEPDKVKAKYEKKHEEDVRRYEKEMKEYKKQSKKKKREKPSPKKSQKTRSGKKKRRVVTTESSSSSYDSYYEYSSYETYSSGSSS
eukprot:TRINITY_DN5218_c0_g1_i1.p1 TRINITY_DN5218_c0_g1~~TRINITY_DN5218_c0_g1_i1.p1  ORF type:complete len:441 (-),score=120.52 TRINITY_DN5218_c0_g1_i1:27-1349(-)